MTPQERGSAHVARGEWHEAVQCYGEAIAISPSDPGVRIGLAFSLIQIGDKVAARDALQVAIGLDPAQCDAHYLLSGIARDDGHLDAAIEHLNKAVQCKPDFVEAQRDLIQTLFRSDPRQALVAATHALEQFPEDAEFWFYVGSASAQTGDTERAIASYKRACVIRPDSVPGRAALARILADEKRLSEALPHCEAWTALAPNDADAHMLLGNARLHVGRVEEAIASYRQSVTIRPHVGVEYTIASLTGNTLDRAPDEFVAQLFDDYAANFDAHLVGALGYNTPRQLAEMLARASARPIRDVLDLGCGTGLMGVELVGVASNIVGVDLSEKMLQKARERNIYKRLEKADLLAAMTGEPAAHYDLIVAADVFVYVGKLDALFDEARRLLRSSGMFVFSVEADTSIDGAATKSGYSLHKQGRYVHTKEYVQGLATTAGFEAIEFRETVCRVNRGVPVQAFLVTLRRP